MLNYLEERKRKRLRGRGLYILDHDLQPQPKPHCPTPTQNDDILTTTTCGQERMTIPTQSGRRRSYPLKPLSYHHHRHHRRKFSSSSSFLTLLIILVGVTFVVSANSSGLSVLRMTSEDAISFNFNESDFLRRNSSSSSSLSVPQPTSVSRAYAHLLRNFTGNNKTPAAKKKSINSRPFSTSLKEDTLSPDMTLKKPSKLFTQSLAVDPFKEVVFDQNQFDLDMEKHRLDRAQEETSTKKSTSLIKSTFLTQTDSGPKIRLEPFFNILSTFQSLALGTSKEQKFSPSYQAITQSISEAQEQTSMRPLKRKKIKKKKKTTTTNDGSVHQFAFTHDDVTSGGSGSGGVPSSPSASSFDDGAIITADSVQLKSQEEMNKPMMMSVSTSISMGGGSGGQTKRDKGHAMTKGGTVEDVGLDLDNVAGNLVKFPPPPPSPSPHLPKPQPFSMSITSRPTTPRAKTPINEGRHRHNTNNNLKRPGSTSPTLTFTPMTMGGFLPLPRPTPVNVNVTTSTTESKERRLRSDHFFQNFHQTDSISDLNAEESIMTPSISSNFPSGYALPTPDSDEETESDHFRRLHNIPPLPPPLIRPQDIQMASRYPTSFFHHHHQNRPPPQLPPPGLGIPPNSFFSLNNNDMPRPHHHSHHDPLSSTFPTYHHQGPHHQQNIHDHQNHYNKMPISINHNILEDEVEEDTTDTNSTSSLGRNPHQKIGLGLMDNFEVFYKQYKIITWAGFFLITALALLSLMVFLYVNNPPTEVVTAKALLLQSSLEGVMNSPQLLKFLTSIEERMTSSPDTGRNRRKKARKKSKRSRLRRGVKTVRTP